MAKQNARRSQPKLADRVIGPADDAGSLFFQMRAFLGYLRERAYSENTVLLRERVLIYFIQWCDERGLEHPQQITRAILERYQRHLFLYRKADGQALTVGSQMDRVLAIRQWFGWLSRGNKILYNPAADLEFPRQERRLPKHIFSTAEAEKVLAQPDLEKATGLRDRALLETLYSTGMRRMEVAALRWSDIDYQRGTVMIRQGKGKKDRMVPIGARALAWIEKYLDEARPQLVTKEDPGVLFVTRLGGGFSTNSLSHLVHGYIDAAQISKSGGCHLFRHTMATLMLENGADVRFIQAMLGHEHLGSTQIYTKVAIQALKKIHTATHPARLTREGQGAESASSPVGVVHHAEPDAP